MFIANILGLFIELYNVHKFSYNPNFLNKIYVFFPGISHGLSMNIFPLYVLKCALGAKCTGVFGVIAIFFIVDNVIRIFLFIKWIGALIILILHNFLRMNNKNQRHFHWDDIHAAVNVHIDLKHCQIVKDVDSK